MKIKTKDMIMVALFAALMAVGAMIKLLFLVVPFSLQPFFCAFAGILLGSRLGALSQLVYVALGLAGAPIFTQGGGITYVVNPSFGYLPGFVAGAFVIGLISEKLKTLNLRNSLIAVCSGLLVIYAIGVPYMFLIVNFYLGKSMTFAAAVKTGFLPFIVKDLVMYAVVAAAAVKILPILRKAGISAR